MNIQIYGKIYDNNFYNIIEIKFIIITLIFAICRGDTGLRPLPSAENPYPISQIKYNPLQSKDMFHCAICNTAKDISHCL